MIIISVDPGPETSAVIIYDTDSPKVEVIGKEIKNQDLIFAIQGWSGQDGQLVIEQVACMGLAVGADVFETVFWSGRFAQAWGKAFDRITRHKVKMHLCGSMRARDGNIRQAIIDRFGGKEKAIGKKKNQGPLYEVSGHAWAALAVAITFAEKGK